jgi:multiple sugar transport system permease protein
MLLYAFLHVVLHVVLHVGRLFNLVYSGRLPGALNQTASLTMNRAKPRVTRRRNLLPYALVLPIILYEGVMLVYPILQGIYGSFTRIELASNRPPTWVGLDNYVRMFNDPAFWKVMQTTLTFTGLVIVVAICAGLLTALLFNNSFRGRPVARAMMMMPWAFPEVPVVMIFIWILSPQFGVVNLLVRWIPGITQNPQWLQVPWLAMMWMVLIASWKAFPFYSLVILAALQSVPQEIYEAARVDGANPWQLFWRITIPSISTTLELLVVLMLGMVI